MHGSALRGRFDRWRRARLVVRFSLGSTTSVSAWHQCRQNSPSKGAVACGHTRHAVEPLDREVQVAINLVVREDEPVPLTEVDLVVTASSRFWQR